MSFKKAGISPPDSVTTRGVATKLSSSKDKVVYTTGRTVIIRYLKNPGLTTTYSGHIHNATVARISPSGYYCASADVTGKVKIWDVVGEQTVKGEYKVISGRVNDLAWDGESKRIIAVGDGKEKFGHAFLVDAGSSIGEILGHSKAINAVSIRHQRPFRAATAGDDSMIIFHTGAPYKYEKTINTHSKSVQDVKYSPSGDHFASVGSDSKFFLYDGKTGETVAEFKDSPHKGSIMACDWSPDSKSIFTSSADCTVKLWDAQTQKAVTTWTVGSGVNHQQIGNTWSGRNDLVSLSMSGALNIFDPRTGDKPSRVFNAPQKSITAITPSSFNTTFLTGTADDRTYSYSPSTQVSKISNGEGHSNNVSGLTTPSTYSDGKVYSGAFDGYLREIEGDRSRPTSSKTASQPKSKAVAGDSTVSISEIDTVVPEGTAYSTVQSLSLQIAFIAPTNLASWAYFNLGLLCSESLSPPINFELTSSYIGFCVDEITKQSPEFLDVQEFVSYITQEDFANPRLAKISDLHPNHHSPLDLSMLNIRCVNISQTVIQQGPHCTESLANITRTGYVISPINDQTNFRPSWILVVFDAISVVQIMRNKWGMGSMEDLIYHLVRHGIEFRTLAPVHSQTLSNSVLLNLTAPPVTMPPMSKPELDENDYAAYVQIRESLIWSPHCKAIFQSGGILWRLAMESVANFNDIINSILDGPNKLDPSNREYFDVNGQRYYDDCIPKHAADTITGCHGLNGSSYWPIVNSWGKARWGSHSNKQGNLMWNNRDEEWFQKHKAVCIVGGTSGQPKTQTKWKKYGTHKFRFDLPFEAYCAQFLVRLLS